MPHYSIVVNVCNNSKFIRLDALQEVILAEINRLIEAYFNPNLIQMPAQKQLLCKRLPCSWNVKP
jgi:hypothetical protein